MDTKTFEDDEMLGNVVFLGVEDPVSVVFSLVPTGRSSF